VIVFSRIETVQGLKLGHDRPRKGVRLAVKIVPLVAASNGAENVWRK